MDTASMHLKHKDSSEGASSIEEASPLEVYGELLEAIKAQGKVLSFASQFNWAKGMPLVQLLEGPGLKNLFGTLATLAPARGGAPNEEWNPLSQRPHAPLLPRVESGELGSEITSLKEGLDGLATLIHEVMHVALWEPFFSGLWQPQNESQFREFSLLAEGYCFFFTDIVVCGSVRAAFPDGEFAFERHAPGQARFHPVRAFRSLGIHDEETILKIYLDGFSGLSTPLWQPQGTHPYAASLARQAYDFYSGSLGYLKELYQTLRFLGCFSTFPRDFCRYEHLPTFLDPQTMHELKVHNYKGYFLSFFSHTLKALELLTPFEVHAIRTRRMLQMRAYYAGQVSWLLKERKLIVLGSTQDPRGRTTSGRCDVRQKAAFQFRQTKDSVRTSFSPRSSSKSPSRRGPIIAKKNLFDLETLKQHVQVYQLRLRTLLQNMRDSDAEVLSSLLAELHIQDLEYENKVRQVFLRHHVWVACRRLIAPKRAGGWIDATPAAGGSRRIPLTARNRMDLGLLLVERSLDLMAEVHGIKKRRDFFASIEKISHVTQVSLADGKQPHPKKWVQLIKQRNILPLWSVPMAGVDPLGNEYRELVFAYQ